jgi:hypothetical protein
LAQAADELGQRYGLFRFDFLVARGDLALIATFAFERPADRLRFGSNQAERFLRLAR